MWQKKGNSIKRIFRKKRMSFPEKKENQIYYFLESIGLYTENEVFIISEKLAGEVLHGIYTGERGMYTPIYDTAIVIAEKNVTEKKIEEVYLHELLHSIAGKLQYESDMLVRSGYLTIENGYTYGHYLEEGYAQFFTQMYFFRQYGEKVRNNDISTIAASGLQLLCIQYPELEKMIRSLRSQNTRSLQSLIAKIRENIPETGNICLKDTPYTRNDFKRTTKKIKECIQKNTQK